MFQKATVMLPFVWPNDKVFDRDKAGQGLISAQNMLVIDSNAMTTKLEHQRVLPVIPGAWGNRRFLEQKNAANFVCICVAQPNKRGEITVGATLTEAT